MTLANPAPQPSSENRVPFVPIGATCAIRPMVSLAGFTSYRVGGPAEWFVSPRTLEDLQACFAWATAAGVPVTLLGLGSNLLVSDRGLPGLVICTRHLRQTQFDEATGRLIAAAGEPIARLAWKAADRGWAGLEWAVGIPGTVGGAVAMNAGAHHTCTADLLVNAQLITREGALQKLSPQDLGFRYRTSVLQGDTSRLVTQATLQLRPGAGADIVTAETRACQERRHATQPYHLP
ncbi:MAG: UDP-N-acetylmuramate dehydrogenase, partial [Cyanobacteria bacterium J069]